MYSLDPDGMARTSKGKQSKADDHVELAPDALERFEKAVDATVQNMQLNRRKRGW